MPGPPPANPSTSLIPLPACCGCSSALNSAFSTSPNSPRQLLPVSRRIGIIPGPHRPRTRSPRANALARSRPQWWRFPGSCRGRSRHAALVHALLIATTVIIGLALAAGIAFHVSGSAPQARRPTRPLRHCCTLLCTSMRNGRFRDRNRPLCRRRMNTGIWPQFRESRGRVQLRAVSSTRLRSSGRPALPNTCRLIILMWLGAQGHYDLGYAAAIRLMAEKAAGAGMTPAVAAVRPCASSTGLGQLGNAASRPAGRRVRAEGPSRSAWQDCAMLAGRPFLVCAGGPLP